MDRIRVVSPADGRIVAERALASDGEIAALLARARTAQASWREVPLRERSEEREHAVLDVIDESLSAEMVSPFDSHPPIGRRLTWLRRMAEDGVGFPRGERDSRPAWSLFDE